MTDTIKDLCLAGLYTDGAHHKQWYLEQILMLVGFDLKSLQRQDYAWDEGIPP